MPPSIVVLGIPIHAITPAETLAWIEAAVDARGRRPPGPRQICTANPEFVMAAQHHPEFRRVLQHADLVLPDGVGLLWAARWQGQRLPARVAGSDLINLIAGRAARQGWRVYFLGAQEGVAQRTAEVLQERYPGMQVAGAFAGSPRPEAEEAIGQRIRAAQPDILLVAYGAPQQDLWIARNRGRLGVPVSIGVGGAFDFVAGVAQRAPRWLQRLGLEWLHRLWRQPWRIRRIFTAAVLFPLAVLRERRKA
ncbi:MAG: WecB/TagA/CpsF family glycosyltransferase [Anaerolineales bacterium]